MIETNEIRRYTAASKPKTKTRYAGMRTASNIGKYIGFSMMGIFSMITLVSFSTNREFHLAAHVVCILYAVALMMFAFILDVLLDIADAVRETSEVVANRRDQ